MTAPFAVENDTCDTFSIQYPQAMLRCLINQITVTHLDIQLSACVCLLLCALGPEAVDHAPDVKSV